MLTELKFQHGGGRLGFYSRLCVCAANGAALEGQSTNTLPGGPEGERAALPQPH